MKIRAYAGNGDYIFVSYAHRDSARVYPILEQMQQDGYRVWFDEGIDPGTEWDENIAAHVCGCNYFIAFLSGNYLASDNCKDELNYARDLGKKRLLVYLEDVQLPAGRLTSSYIFAYNRDFLVYNNDANKYIRYYKNTFQHGGISMEEMIVPFIVLQPK